MSYNRVAGAPVEFERHHPESRPSNGAFAIQLNSTEKEPFTISETVADLT